ncbi:hypothetical protein FISHEDRAFT_21250, partial [Fistulina hepatica ATCC 64428]
LAMVSVYSPPDQELWKLSHETLWCCEYRGQEALKVVPVSLIQSVVGMVPFPHIDEHGQQFL